MGGLITMLQRTITETIVQCNIINKNFNFILFSTSYMSVF